MLTQYQIIMKPEQACRPRPEWAYCMYSGLLKTAPDAVGEKAHNNSITPVSQFVTETQQGLKWTVNLLGEDSEEKFSPCLEQAESFYLDKQGIRLNVTQQSKIQITDVDELLQLAEMGKKIHRLRFCTACGFKSQGKYLNLPTPRLIIQSLINKWNGCILECPIDDVDGKGMEALAAGLECGNYNLHSCSYRIKGNLIPGFCGELELINNLSGFHAQLADALLLFSDFAGVGIKTTLGMGGTVHI